MINIFVDETSDEKYKDYFGLFCTAIHHNFYPQIKREAQQILRDGGWDFNVEFKGSYLFSAKKGCIEVDIDKRIELAEKILELTTATKNARMKLSYFRKSSTNHKQDYLEHLPFLVHDILGRYCSAPQKLDSSAKLNKVHCSREGVQHASKTKFQCRVQGEGGAGDYQRHQECG